MKKFRKRKGSSLILVVFITAVVFTVATSMVAVVTNDYRTRVNESKKLQNLYQSDSGLDVAYNLISKNAQNATMYAYNYIKANYNNQTVQNGGIERQFNQAFKRYLDESTLKSSIEQTSIRKLKDSINAKTSKASDLEDLDNYEMKELTDNDIQEITKGNQFAKGELSLVDYDARSNDKQITITVQSKFTSVNTQGNDPKAKAINGKLDNTKTIKTKYIIKAPDYNAPSTTQQTGSKEDRNYNVEKAITADGNLNIEDGAKLDVSGLDVKGKDIDGDIWIKGSAKATKEDYDVANDKYAYGIRMNNSSLNISGNAYTNGTLGLSNGSNAVIQKSLYALNAYTGPISKKDFSEDKGGNSLAASEVYTNNDLVMNSSASKILAGDYTGISSEKEASTNEGTSKSKALAAKNSSSIIVNTDKNKRDGAVIQIKNAVVPGFAYMNTAGNSFYGTGEAVAVKGNYVAYTENLLNDKDAKKSDYNPVSEYDIKKFKPWDLVEYPNDSVDKAKNFKLYWDTQSKNIDNGGVDITNLKSYGAAPYNDGKGNMVKGYTSDNSITNIQNAAKSGFGTLVYGMGQTKTSGNDYYKNGENNMVTVAGNNNVIKFDKLESRMTDYIKETLMKPIKLESVNDIYANYNGYALLNADSSKTLNITETSGNLTVQYDGEEKLEVEGNKIGAVIITNGNVNISGNVNLQGTIIAGGSVNIAKGSNVNVVCNRYAIRKIIHQINSTLKIDKDTGLLEGISDSEPIEGEEPVIIPEDSISNAGALNDDATNGYFDSSKCIKQGLWNLVKDTKANG